MTSLYVGKRVFDLIFASIAFLFILPLLVIIGLLVIIESGLPYLFNHTRLGMRGKHIRVWKIRTMWPDAEERLLNDPTLYQQYVCNNFKLPAKNDPRLTLVGRLLRRTSFDELPQFWNVIKGDMSIVGPRPIVPNEIIHYDGHEDLFLSVRPGITGLWQVSGRSEIGYPERSELELKYIQKMCPRYDLNIIVRTIWVVLTGRGAH